MKGQSADFFKKSTKNDEMIKDDTILKTEGEKSSNSFGIIKNKMTDLNEMISIKSPDFCTTIKSKPSDSVISNMDLENTFNPNEEMVGKDLLSEIKNNVTNIEIKMV